MSSVSSTFHFLSVIIIIIIFFFPSFFIIYLFTVIIIIIITIIIIIILFYFFLCIWVGIEISCFCSTQHYNNNTHFRPLSEPSDSSWLHSLLPLLQSWGMFAMPRKQKMCTLLSHPTLSLIRQHFRVSDLCNFHNFSPKSECGYVNSPDLASGFPIWWDLVLPFWDLDSGSQFLDPAVSK